MDSTTKVEKYVTFNTMNLTWGSFNKTTIKRQPKLKTLFVVILFPFLQRPLQMLSDNESAKKLVAKTLEVNLNDDDSDDDTEEEEDAVREHLTNEYLEGDYK